MTDLAWVFIAWPVASVGVGLFVGKVIRMGDTSRPQPDVVDREAQANLYALRPFDRRTDHVVPRNRQHWS